MNQSNVFDMMCSMNTAAHARLVSNPDLVYDYRLVDEIRGLEREYQSRIDAAKASVAELSKAVLALRERRLSLELVSE